MKFVSNLRPGDLLVGDRVTTLAPAHSPEYDTGVVKQLTSRGTVMVAWELAGETYEEPTSELALKP